MILPMGGGGGGVLISTSGTLYMFYILTCIDESYTPWWHLLFRNDSALLTGNSVLLESNH